ncbi:MAG: GNAT family N-acetyltransferase [Actinobacteria bacterium]|nr:GNAT family N-acetyltransferase [Actinomycetota bacterium]
MPQRDDEPPSDRTRSPYSQGPKVRRATHRDVEVLAGVLTRAFYDDPVAIFMIPSGKRRLRALAKFYRIMLVKQYLSFGEVWTTDDLAGAALWAPPNKPPPTLRDLLYLLPVLPQFLGPSTVAALRLIARIDAKRPKVEHWYLSTLGTDPSSQGRGVGSALLNEVLSRCDEAGMPAFLESSKESNVPFYARHGFDVTGEIHAPRQGPTLYLMSREPC